MQVHPGLAVWSASRRSGRKAVNWVLRCENTRTHATAGVFVRLEQRCLLASMRILKTETTMMKMTKSLCQSLCKRVGQFSLAMGAALATSAAMAVNNLPGGPAVNQLDLHPPVTKIAQ